MVEISLRIENAAGEVLAEAKDTQGVELCYRGEKMVINNNEIGKLSQFLYDTITGIQKGVVEDTLGFTYRIK